MTGDTLHPDRTEDRSDDNQHAVEACQHAVDALENGDLSHARRRVQDYETSGWRTRTTGDYEWRLDADEVSIDAPEWVATTTERD